jgi:hypothetical protein
MRLYTAFVVLFLFSTPIARALDTEVSRSSLRGLKGVAVVIEELPTESEQNGLTVSAIRTDVELKLRQAGIVVAPLLDPATAGDAALMVDVGILPDSNVNVPIWSFSIQVSLGQNAALLRDPSIFLPLATTWGVSGFGSVGKQNLRSVRDFVKDLVDKFINAYLTVNPKK